MKTTKLIIWTLVSLILISSAFSLGLSPAEKKTDYFVGTQEFNYKVINNENKNLHLKIYALGQLAEYITFEQDELILTPAEKIKDFKAVVTLPEDLVPGENIGKIVIEESLLEDTDKQTGIYAKLKVISKLVVMVPIPDKYIKVSIDVKDGSKEKPLDMVTTITNLGKKDIGEVKAEFGIFNQGNKIDDLKTDSKSLAKQETAKLLTQLNTSSYSEGFYNAIATIKYDQYELEMGKDFKVGAEKVDILDYTKYFVQGKVNKFNIDVENKWNRKIRNAFALVYIAGFDALKTLTYDLEPKQVETLVTYWDTVNVGLGTYDSNVSLKYLNKTTTKQGKVHVVKESTLSQPSGIKDYLVYVILGVVILIGLNLFWFFLLKKRSVK